MIYNNIFQNIINLFAIVVFVFATIVVLSPIWHNYVMSDKINKYYKIIGMLVGVAVLIGGVRTMYSAFVADRSQIAQNTVYMKENRKNIKEIQKAYSASTQEILISLSRIETEIKYISKRNA